jgi:MinD superfamily P-loop ATPase
MMQESVSGSWFVSSTRYGPLVHAELAITQENSGQLVALVRQKAKQIAEEARLDWIISDGPAGMGNPVISALFEASLALLVTEPTLPGISGLERTLSICHRFRVPALVCINKYDINENHARHIESLCLSQGIDIAARVPFDEAVTRAAVQGIPVVEYSDNGVSQQIRALWEFILKALEN